VKKPATRVRGEFRAPVPFYIPEYAKIEKAKDFSGITELFSGEP